jgi:hypothetical protein
MTNGKMFDSSVQRGEPAAFPLHDVIKGWTEGLQLMVEGEKTRFWIPAELAYGDPPQRPGAPAGMLVFDVELISINPGDVCAICGKPAVGYCHLRKIPVCEIHRFFTDEEGKYGKKGTNWQCP